MQLAYYVNVCFYDASYGGYVRLEYVLIILKDLNRPQTERQYNVNVVLQSLEKS